MRVYDRVFRMGADVLLACFGSHLYIPDFTKISTQTFVQVDNFVIGKETLGLLSDWHRGVADYGCANCLEQFAPPK